MFRQRQTDRSTPQLVATHESHCGRLHPTAMRVIEELAEECPPRGNLAGLRQHHAVSRRRFLAPLEPIHGQYQILNAEPGLPPLAVFLPAQFDAAANFPAIVFLHGGGWTVGSLETYEPFCRQLANATGSVLIWVHYRLAPEHPFPAAFDDTRHVLRWVNQNAARLNIDAARVMLAGEGAGGNLAAAASQAERYDNSAVQPWRQILLCPCLDMMACMLSLRTFSSGYLLTARLHEWHRSNYAPDAVKPGHWRLSPLFAHDMSRLPPTVLLYAGFDPLRDEAVAYATRLAAAGVPVQTLYFPNMMHGFITLGGAIPAANAVAPRIAAALWKWND